MLSPPKDKQPIMSIDLQWRQFINSKEYILRLDNVVFHKITPSHYPTYEIRLLIVAKTKSHSRDIPEKHQRICGCKLTATHAITYAVNRIADLCDKCVDRLNAITVITVNQTIYSYNSRFLLTTVVNPIIVYERVALTHADYHPRMRLTSMLCDICGKTGRRGENYACRECLILIIRLYTAFITPRIILITELLPWDVVYTITSIMTWM